jgi:hypothetical protein
MSVIETLDDAIRRRRHECSDAAAKRFHASVRAVLAAQKGRPKAFIATCMLLKVGSGRFVVTAAHVTDWLDDHELYIAGSEGTQPVQFVGRLDATAVPPGGRRADKVDVAFWKLTDAAVGELGEVSFIDESQIYLNRADLAYHQYLAMGYPVSRNKRGIDIPNKGLVPVLSKYTADLNEDPKLPGKVGVSGERHLFLKYEKVSESGTGERRDTFKPDGLSGGPLFHLGNFAAMGRFEATDLPVGRLAGMIIERKDDNLVAVKIQVVLDAIRKIHAT